MNKCFGLSVFCFMMFTLTSLCMEKKGKFGEVIKKIKVTLPKEVTKLLREHVADIALLTKNGVDPNSPFPPRSIRQ